jgi:TfoX/Sxy family transcriptional regulator of competence genes
MAYDEQLATRIRVLLEGERAVIEKKMFGGLAFMSHGKMFSGILSKDLVVRVGPEANDQVLKEPHTRPMDFTGRPMKGYVYVGPAGTNTAAQLRKWLTRGQTFVASLPPAKRKPPRALSTVPQPKNRRRTS